MKNVTNFKLYSIYTLWASSIGVSAGGCVGGIIQMVATRDIGTPVDVVTTAALGFTSYKLTKAVIDFHKDIAKIYYRSNEKEKELCK